MLFSIGTSVFTVSFHSKPNKYCLLKAVACQEFGSGGGGQNIFDTRGVHKLSFPLVLQILIIYYVKRLLVRDRVVTSHDACTRGTS